MKVTFNNIKTRQDSVAFFGGAVNSIVLDFDTNEVHFIGNASASHTFFYNYQYGGGVSHHSFRIPDISGEGSVAVVIFDNGTFGIQDYLSTLPDWIRSKFQS